MKDSRNKDKNCGDPRITRWVNCAISIHTVSSFHDSRAYYHWQVAHGVRSELWKLKKKIIKVKGKQTIKAFNIFIRRKF